MRYVRNHGDKDRTTYVACELCGKAGRLFDMVVDIDGVPFRAYLHPLCVNPEQLEHVRHATCVRPECKECKK